MQIDSHTTQAELLKLYSSVTRRELMQGTPLNLRLFLRYALLFVLFPGMVRGFRFGLGLTFLFCLCLGTLLAMHRLPESVLAVQIWLGLGVCLLAWISWRTTRTALAVYHRRMTTRPAETPLPENAPLPAQRHTLRWRRSDDDDEWVAELEFAAREPGVYAFLLCVQGMGKRRLLTLGRCGVCRVQSAGDRGELQVLLLYKLGAGAHRLRWALQPRKGAAPATQALWLNHPDNKAE